MQKNATTNLGSGLVNGFGPRVAARVVRRRFRNNVCRVAPRLSPEQFSNASAQSDCMSQWRSHFRDAAPLHAADFDASHFRRVQRAWRRIRATRDVHFADPNLDDVPFTLPELKAALQHCILDKTPGVDKIPYRALCLDIPWWQEAILQFLDLCRSYGCVPSMWKLGIVVHMAGTLNASDRDEYRPITLASCFAKTLEKNILSRIKPAIDPQLDSFQAGFRWGTDVQA